MKMIPYDSDIQTKDRKKILIWLASICGCILLTLALGGATRLTNSGLSIAEWKPLMGALPPLSDNEWNRIFDLYKQIPEYRIENPTMDLQGFKFIFFWEYLHRNMGRLIGLVFLIPFVWFSIRRSFSASFRNRVLVGFVLGGLQGALGWFMVSSGLSERTDVSHYRLAAHLCLAFFIFSYFLSLFLRVLWGKRRKPDKENRGLIWGLWILHSIIGLQIIYGAFVAGLRAGYAYNTFPKMYGEWLPHQALSESPLWLNFFENPAMVQFIHRWIGASIVVIAFGVFAFSRKVSIGLESKRLMRTLLAALVLQFALGVFTLLSHMNFGIALLHQVGALSVFGLIQTLRFHLCNSSLISRA